MKLYRCHGHDDLGWVQALGAAVGAIHDAVAAVELHSVVDPGEALLLVLVAAVSDPTVGLLQHRGAEVVLWVPPIGGARRLAACAKDALVHAVEQVAVLPALQILLLAFFLLLLPLEPW